MRRWRRVPSRFPILVAVLALMAWLVTPVNPGVRRAPVAPASASAASVPVLMYHFIRANPLPADEIGFRLSVTPWDFDAEMHYLFTRGVHTVTFDQVWAAVDGGQPLPPNSVILTFDDGFADFADTAVPIMQRYGFTAISYAVPDFIGRPNYMTLGQLQRVAAAGFTIGAHTMDHLDLAALSAMVQAAQIRQSRQVLQQWTGQPVSDFAYPYGAYDGTTLSLVAGAGFRDAVTTRLGAFESDGDRLTIPRVRVSGGETLASFAQSLGPLAPATAVSGDVLFGRSGVAGMPVATCTYPTYRTDGGGHFLFYAVVGEPYCLHLASPSPPTRLVLDNNSEVGSAGSFEYQIAGVNCHRVCPSPWGTWDRPSDVGEWFHFADTAGAVAATDGHGYVLDTFGDISHFGTAADPTGQATWPGWSIARDIALRPDGVSGYVLDGFGGLHPFGGAPSLAAGAYWPGWDIARRLVLTPDGNGGYVLDGFGGLHRFGDAPTLAPSAYWPGWDIARGVVLLPSGSGGYVLDGFGGLHPFGAAASVPVSAYWPGWDIAHSVTLIPGRDAGYVLDGFGGLHPFGGAPAVVAPGYWPDWDIARSVVISPGRLTTVDGFGGVHSTPLPIG